MKCPVCETESCKRKEIETENGLYEYKCVRCETFYIEKDLAELIETEFERVLKTNLDEDTRLNKEKIDSYRDVISEYIDSHKQIHITFDRDNIRENQISIKKLLKVVHLMVSADDNIGIFETNYKNKKGHYNLYYDSVNKYAWAVYLPEISGTGIEMGSVESVYSKEEAFRKLKEMVDNKV